MSADRQRRRGSEKTAGKAGSGADGFRFATKLILGRINPAFEEGSREGGSTAEEITERVDRIGDIELPAIIRVPRIETTRSLTFGEKKDEEVDRIGDAQAPIEIHISSLEENGQRIRKEIQRIGGDIGTSDLFKVAVKIPPQGFLEHGPLAVELRSHELEDRHGAVKTLDLHRRIEYDPMPDKGIVPGG